MTILSLVLRQYRATSKELEIGMEATGHYWLALYSFLVKNHFIVHVVNPIQTDSLFVMATFPKLLLPMKKFWNFAIFLDSDFRLSLKSATSSDKPFASWIKFFRNMSQFFPIFSVRFRG